jgi:hypothetical protein
MLYLIKIDNPLREARRMVTSGGFGGGGLPMSGEFGPFMAVLALIVIIFLIWLVMQLDF